MHLPTPKQIKKEYGLRADTRERIFSFRNKIQDILVGKNSQIAIVTGPCSIHDAKSAIEYGKRLKQLAEKVRQRCFLVMRVYLEKPRTISGWKGIVYDPDLDGSHDVYKGIKLAREVLLDLADLEIPIATEFLDPLIAPYFEDIVSWGFIGARTSSSPIHRQLASSLAMPIGFKNSLEGNIDTAIYAVASAKSSQNFIKMDDEGYLKAIESKGNPHTHIVLRGACDFTNYDPESIHEAVSKLKKANLFSRILIDCSHGNSRKQFSKQKEVFLTVLQQILRGNSKIMGMMLESHIEEGSQILSEDISSLSPTISITDPCISWKTTEELIQQCFETLSDRHYFSKTSQVSQGFASSSFSG